QQALAELGVVVVDLPGALRGEDHQGVLRRHLVQQVVDRRVGDALGGGTGGGIGQRHAHLRTLPVAGMGGAPALCSSTLFSTTSRAPGPTINSTNRATTACRSSLTTTMSNSRREAISSCAVSSRRANWASLSVPRLRSRRTS